MGLYEKYCLPHVINCACGLKAVRRQRQKIVPLAKGRVLEVGLGTGLNLPFYTAAQVEFVWGLEPSAAMRKQARRNVEQAAVEVRWLDLPGEEIPLDDASVDTVLLTYTLCTIPDWKLALQQMRRVLKPGGQLLFCEHGAAPDADIRRWQDRITPVWKQFAGGCHLNRPIPQFLEGGGFSIQHMETMYLPGPKIATFNYWGSATRA